jgi:hypothetical protein
MGGISAEFLESRSGHNVHWSGCERKEWAEKSKSENAPESRPARNAGTVGFVF